MLTNNKRTLMKIRLLQGNEIPRPYEHFKKLAVIKQELTNSKLVPII